MDEHEINRMLIKNLKAKLDEAHEREAELELDIQEKDELIASMARELMRYHADREFSVA